MAPMARFIGNDALAVGTSAEGHNIRYDMKYVQSHDYDTWIWNPSGLKSPEHRLCSPQADILTPDIKTKSDRV